LQVEPLEMRLCPSGHLLVTNWGGDSVPRYDESSGAFVDAFVAKHSGGMNQPYGIVFGPHDHNLYVSTGEYGGPGQLKAVLRYEGITGAFIDKFSIGGDLQGPRGILFGPDGNLYVADKPVAGPEGRIVRYDGHTGAYIDEFVPLGSGLTRPSGLVFGPAGKNTTKLDLYVTSALTQSILRYDGTTGAFLGEFVASGSGGLGYPIALTFGPGGDLYVASDRFSSNKPPAVFCFQGPSGNSPGAFISVFVPPASGGLETPFGLLFGPDANGDGRQDLYVASSELPPGATHNGKNGSVKRYDGATGAFIDTFVTPRSGGLDDPALMTFTETDPVTFAFNEHKATYAPDAFFAALMTDEELIGIGNSVFVGAGKNRRV